MNSCVYCSSDGIQRGDDLYVCEGCWTLLQNPETALPLIRGHLSFTLRGQIPEDQLETMINKFMVKISKFSTRS
jgi:hypothetical protein